MIEIIAAILVGLLGLFLVWVGANMKCRDPSDTWIGRLIFMGSGVGIASVAVLGVTGYCGC